MTAGLARVVPLMLAQLQLAGCDIAWSVAAQGRLLVRRDGIIRIGGRTVFAGGMTPTELVAHAHALVDIGRDCVVNSAVRIAARDTVIIGNGCLIAGRVTIVDHDETTTAPIIIGNNVWLAHGVTVAPGITIGSNAVVSAGSVVTKDVPADSLAVGDPARAVPLSMVAHPAVSATQTS